MNRRLTNPRAIAADVILRVLDEGAYAGPTLDRHLSTPGLSDVDRALATELTYGTLRWALALDETIRRALTKPDKKIDTRLRAHLLVGAYQLLFLDERIPVHAAVNETVALVKKVRPGLGGLANAVLRHLGSPLHHQLRPDASLDDVARAIGVPLALAHALTFDLPVDTRQRALMALKERPSLGIYVRGSKERRDEIMALLAAESRSVRAHAFIDEMILVEGAGLVSALPGFDEGEILILDPGSAMVAMLVDAGRGERVLDLCAAPGTKTMLLASRVAPTGTVTAVELHPERASRIRENATRLSLPVVVKEGDGTDRELLGDEMFDAVLVDAPCSGLGTIRRRPEIALRQKDPARETLPSLQGRLLDEAAHRVKPGGALIYAVCTPMPEEGPDVVDAFLSRTPGFRSTSIEPTSRGWPGDVVDARGFLRPRPHLHDADAFFAARFTRTET